jgi:hypothetical protein
VTGDAVTLDDITGRCSAVRKGYNGFAVRDLLVLFRFPQ